MWLGSSMHCILKDLPICNKSSCPVPGRPFGTGRVKRRPGLKFLPEIPQMSLPSRPGSDPELGRVLASVSTVSVGLLGVFEKEDHRLEKENTEELEMGDGCVD